MELFTLLETLEEMLENSKTVPFSGKAIIEKEEIKNIYKEARLKVIDDSENNNLNSNDEPKDDKPVEEEPKQTGESKEETQVITKQEIKEEKEQVYKTMTMSDFFDEFKI